MVGEAAKSEQGLDADNLGFLRSPGFGAQHVSELGFSGEGVHVSMPKGDKLAFAGAVHGNDPTSTYFGATAFESTGKHDEYHQTEEGGDAALVHFGDVMVGDRRSGC